MREFKYSVNAWRLVLLATFVSALALTFGATAADNKNTAAQKEHQIIQVLKSKAAPAEKALACKQLAVYGSKAAVPALAKLLTDPQLASWARIALEAIPDPACDAALRKAMGRAHGRLLAGIINSIGVRGDTKAVSGLIRAMKNPDEQVASAAAVALGRIGGDEAGKALVKALADTPPGVRASVAEGCVRCAEGFSNHGDPTRAVALYEAVRQANVPKQLVLEATRGTILAEPATGLPLLREQLRSSEPAAFAMALRTARELPDGAATELLASELKSCGAERQPKILLALADHNDATASATVRNSAKDGPKALRITAIGALEQRGSVSSIPVLLEAALSEDAEVAKAGMGALTRLPGDAVDADLLGRLADSTGKTRRVLIELAGKRAMDQALPAILKSAEDPEPEIRTAAVQAIGALGDEKQAPTLVRLLQNVQAAKERADLETALRSICARNGARCVPHLLPLVQSSDTALRQIALPLLASAGGPDALNAVKSAVQDNDESVRDDAVRTLSTWPDNWPDDGAIAEPLLALAKESGKTNYQVLALRGYLHFVEGNKQLKEREKVEKVKEALPLIQRPEELQMVIGVAGDLPAGEALDLLQQLAPRPGAKEEACAAIVKLAGEKDKGLSKTKRRRALQAVVENSSEAATRTKAENLLKGL